MDFKLLLSDGGLLFLLQITQEILRIITNTNNRRARNPPTAAPTVIVKDWLPMSLTAPALVVLTFEDEEVVTLLVPSPSGGESTVVTAIVSVVSLISTLVSVVESTGTGVVSGSGIEVVARGLVVVSGMLVAIKSVFIVGNGSVELKKHSRTMMTLIVLRVRQLVWEMKENQSIVAKYR